MTYGPLQLTPRLVAKPWGGRRLERFGRVLPPGVDVGESWDVADLPQSATPVPAPWTPVARGAWAGRRLGELLAEDRGALLGDARSVAGRFPLLVKLLDAREHLSVQVHPPRAYVEHHPDTSLKTETWAVLDAAPGARVFLGFRPGVTLDEVRPVLGTPALVPLLQQVPVRVGDIHHVPAGTVHALGAGVLVAEVQTPSDTTFRLYDWSQEYGRTPRALHLDEGLAALRAGWRDASIGVPGGVDLPLRTPDYEIDRVEVRSGADVPLAAGAARVLLVLSGRLVCDDLAEPLVAGASVVLPAAWGGSVRGTGDATFLVVAVG